MEAKDRQEISIWGSTWRAAAIVALTLGLGAWLASPLRASAAIRSHLPAGQLIASVSCAGHDRPPCIKVVGGGPSRYSRAPTGYSRDLRCRWYDIGYSRSLGVEKHLCIRAPSHRRSSTRCGTLRTGRSVYRISVHDVLCSVGRPVIARFLRGRGQPGHYGRWFCRLGAGRHGGSGGDAYCVGPTVDKPRRSVVAYGPGLRQP